MRLLHNEPTITLRGTKKIKPTNAMEHNPSQETDNLFNWSNDSQPSMKHEDSLPSQHPTNGSQPKSNESSSHTYFF
jgi:hypothetical protein